MQRSLSQKGFTSEYLCVRDRHTRSPSFSRRTERVAAKALRNLSLPSLPSFPLRRVVPHCAFNGGRDVFIDIGHKALGIRALQARIGAAPAATVHFGDRFTRTGNDLRARDVANTLWVTGPAETEYLLTLLLGDVRRARMHAAAVAAATSSASASSDAAGEGAAAESAAVSAQLGANGGTAPALAIGAGGVEQAAAAPTSAVPPPSLLSPESEAAITRRRGDIFVLGVVETPRSTAEELLMLGAGDADDVAVAVELAGAGGAASRGVGDGSGHGDSPAAPPHHPRPSGLHIPTSTSGTALFRGLALPSTSPTGGSGGGGGGGVTATGPVFAPRPHPLQQQHGALSSSSSSSSGGGGGSPIHSWRGVASSDDTALPQVYGVTAARVLRDSEAAAVAARGSDWASAGGIIVGAIRPHGGNGSGASTPVSNSSSGAGGGGGGNAAATSSTATPTAGAGAAARDFSGSEGGSSVTAPPNGTTVPATIAPTALGDRT